MPTDVSIFHITTSPRNQLYFYYLENLFAHIQNSMVLLLRKAKLWWSSLIIYSHFLINFFP